MIVDASNTFSPLPCRGCFPARTSARFLPCWFLWEAPELWKTPEQGVVVARYWGLCCFKFCCIVRVSGGVEAHHRSCDVVFTVVFN